MPVEMHLVDLFKRIDVRKKALKRKNVQHKINKKMQPETGAGGAETFIAQLSLSERPRRQGGMTN